MGHYFLDTQYFCLCLFLIANNFVPVDSLSLLMNNGQYFIMFMDYK